VKQRGLDADGYAAEVKERVRKYMNQDGGPPPALPPKGGPLPLIFDVVQALNVMVASIMVLENIQKANCNIKMFLTLFERLDSGLRGSGKDPAWVSSYNFVCVLNLPMLMEKYGPLRNLWEGGLQGEGLLRFVKPGIGMGVRVNWSTNVMQMILRDKALSAVTSTVVGKTESVDSDQMLYQRYRGIAKLTMDWRAGRPISMIVVNTGQMGCAISAGEMCGLMRTDFRYKKNGHSYHQWALDVNDLRQYQDKDITNYCLLLPALGVEGFQESETVFTAIDSEWNEIDDNGDFVQATAQFTTI
jgi:hypothetical protein